MSWDVVYVSPHADDAVFSAGGAIALAARAGRRVAVLTVFSDGEAAEARRREDREAAARLGAGWIDLALPEAPARDAALVGRALFRPIADDEPLVAVVRARVLEAAAGAEVVAPLGVGHHADHQIAHAACADVASAFYEDMPYALAGGLLARRLEELGVGPPASLVEQAKVARFWAGRPLLAPLGLFAPLGGAAVAAAQLARWSGARRPLVEDRRDVSAVLDHKMSAIAAYDSQWPLFFPSLAAFRTALAAHSFRIGSARAVERSWRARED